MIFCGGPFDGKYINLEQIKPYVSIVDSNEVYIIPYWSTSLNYCVYKEIDNRLKYIKGYGYGLMKYENWEG